MKVCPYIDGTNHISRIARLANCDLNLTRLAISHLLYGRSFFKTTLALIVALSATTKS